METSTNNTSRPKKQHYLICYLVLILGIFFGLSIPRAMAADLTSEVCLNNTGSEGDCKDCCDCLDNAEEHKACRDNCIAKSATADGFSTNTDLITVDAPSAFGPNYDYSEAVAAGNEQDCKTYCDESDVLACGDRKYCRDVCNATFTDSNNDPDDQNGNNISIDQAISDEAQMKTIAFSSLAFLTGDMCSDTFFPPGKVSDFFGFQYLRDITPNGFGHNTEFAGRISDSVLSILAESQVQALVTLANTQSDQVDAYGFKRFVLIKAFRRLLDNDLPDGSTGLDRHAVMEFAADLYEIDGEISYARAQVLGGIVAEFTDAQKTELAELLDAFNTLFEEAGEGGSIDNEDWPASTPVDLSGLESHDGRVLVSTYATQLFSWYLGSVEGDTYFCPERHGTYFGSFYMKDIPPLTATEAVTIDTNLTAEMGTAFLNVLDNNQEALVTGLVEIQKTDLNNIVAKREEISQKLRLFMDGSPVDKNEVLALVRQYGEYEGEMVYHYGTNFTAVGHTLTNDQADMVMGIRLDYYEGFPDYRADSTVYDCSGAWLYSERLDEMPDIENTDFLFGSSSDSVVADGALITLISDGFSFAEGPACDSSGNVFFSDITDNIIYKWSINSELSVFRENAGGANGLFFDVTGNLLACEGSNQQIVAMDALANVTVLTDEYNGLPFNEPNDLWVAPDGGVYFTDPVYFAATVPQGGEHVYYLPPDQSSTIRVIDDMIRPNGIVGTADGSTLYVTDHGAGATYRYTINSDGTLSDKQLFASVGADGMTIDNEGNIYLTNENGVQVYDASGNLVETIIVPETPTNVCFAGSDGRTLFITTRTSLYALRMKVMGASYTTTALDYNVVDTGQVNCYGDSAQITCPSSGESFYGQDAQYSGNQPSYTLSGDGLTVYDNVTGLTWQKSPDTDRDGDIDSHDKFTWTEAQTYPTALNAENYGGYDDWRLPTIKELYSLIDFSGTDPSQCTTEAACPGLKPFIDTDDFDFAYGDTNAGERVIDSQWASSTLYVSTVDGRLLFGVNFADGRIKGYGLTDPAGGSKTFFVICVRGNTNYGVNNFVNNGDGTVTDNATGLMWRQNDSGSGMLWGDALDYAENLTHAGYDDWRLPNAKELQSILDYTRSPDTTSSAAIDPLFNVTPITNEEGQADYPYYWASTTHVGYPNGGSSAAYLAFGRGLGYMDGQWRDVHGAGCQRSDPKVGDPNDYPFGRGPQGDAIRIYNYVRLVRDVTNESPFLSLSLASTSVSEAAGAAVTTGTVTRNNADLSSPLTVMLLSSDTSEIIVPETVVIPTNQASLTFDITAVDDLLVDGTQTVTITASAVGYTAGADTVAVTDDDGGGGGGGGCFIGPMLLLLFE